MVRRSPNGVGRPSQARAFNMFLSVFSGAWGSRHACRPCSVFWWVVVSSGRVWICERRRHRRAGPCGGESEPARPCRREPVQTILQVSRPFPSPLAGDADPAPCGSDSCDRRLRRGVRRRAPPEPLADSCRHTAPSKTKTTRNADGKSNPPHTSASADYPFATDFQPVVTRLVSWFEPASAGLWVGLQTLALIWLKPQFQAG